MHNRDPSRDIGHDDSEEVSYGLSWGPTDDPKEMEKRWHWDSVIPLFYEMVDQFIRSRKGRGKEYFEILAHYFIDEMYEMNIRIDDVCFETASEDAGWIRSSKIEHDLLGEIPHRTTLFRLLADMVDAEILQKKIVVEKLSRSSDKKQKPSVYYRLLLHESFVSHLHVMTHAELLPVAIKYYKGFKKYGELYLGAKEWAIAEGIAEEDIDVYLREWLLPWKEDGDDLYRINLNIDLDALLKSV
jgi:hypothetical protein